MTIYKNRSNIWEALGMLLIGRSSNCHYYFFLLFLEGMNHLFLMFPKEAMDLCPVPLRSAFPLLFQLYGDIIDI